MSAETTDVKTGFQISYDRNSVVLRLYGKHCYDEYKSALKSVDTSLIGDMAEILPATVTPDGYMCTARGKATLKELVCGEETVGLGMLSGLASSVKELAQAADRSAVDLRDFVFDYNAVFVRDPLSDYRFVYMPGLRDASGRTTATELVKIIFFNADTEDIPVTDYGEICDLIKGMRDDSDANAIAEDLGNLLEKLSSLSNEISLKDRVVKALKLKGIKRDTEDRSERRSIYFLIKGDGLLSGTEKRTMPERDKSVLLKIGRDNDWADISVPNMSVSRKHAEIILFGDGRVKIKDFSLNGTAVDGREVEESAEKNVEGGDVIIRFADNCGLTVSATRAGI